MWYQNSEEHEEQFEDVKNRRKLYVLICFGAVFEVFGCLYEICWKVGEKSDFSVLYEFTFLQKREKYCARSDWKVYKVNFFQKLSEFTVRVEVYEAEVCE